MSKNTPSEADSKNVSPEPTAATKKAPRCHVVRGISYPVVRSYFDSRRGAVVDVIRVNKTVQDRRGNIKDVELFRHVVCPDQDIQTRFAQKDTRVEVNIDV